MPSSALFVISLEAVVLGFDQVFSHRSITSLVVAVVN